MPNDHDPIQKYARSAKAVRRVGTDAQCSCGERRPEAFTACSTPPVCAACKRKSEGTSTRDEHHVAGKANSPVTIPVPVNDHRAELSVAQYDWPKETLDNKDHSPLLAAAGAVRGSVDTIIYLLKTALLWVADLLELLHEFLFAHLGSGWWIGTPLERFAPKG